MPSGTNARPGRQPEGHHTHERLHEERCDDRSTDADRPVDRQHDQPDGQANPSDYRLENDDPLTRHAQERGELRSYVST